MAQWTAPLGGKAMARARVERRLAAILAADMVGYSRLMEQDEAGTLAAIKAVREGAIDPLLAEHKGRIVKLMGDGAIVEFASVVDAVACAVAIQKAVAERAGRSAAGPADRVPDRHQPGRRGGRGRRHLGDGVNVAARLEQLCEPGGVLVSGTAYDQLQGKLGLPLEFTGEQQVKNIARPVEAYRVRLDGMALAGCARRAPAFSAGCLDARRPLLLALVVLRRAFGGSGRSSRRPGKPSIAVLPFDNLGGDEATGGSPTGSPRTSSPISPASATST